MRLHLFASGVAFFAVELSMSPKEAIQVDGCVRENLNLDHLFTLRNMLCRAYPSYFNHLGPKGYPVMRRWAGNDKPADDGSLEQHLQDFRAFRAIPIAPIWQHALAPLIVGKPTSGQGDWSWHQVLDERIPDFLFLGTPSAYFFKENDWARLCFREDAGSGSPYAHPWLEDFHRRHCFDMPCHNSDSALPSATRYLFTNYAFAVVDTVDPNDRNFSKRPMQCHFYRRYFQMGFLNHFQFVALCALSHWISDAVTHFGRDKCKESFRMIMRDLEELFLEFTQLYWFADVPNQLQAREMYARWRGQIGAETLYEEVAKQLNDVRQFLGSEK